MPRVRTSTEPGQRSSELLNYLLALILAQKEVYTCKQDLGWSDPACRRGDQGLCQTRAESGEVSSS